MGRRIETEFQISAIADEPLRGAIGGLCIHWALLELIVERVIANLEGNPEVVTYQQDLNRRTETLKTLAKESATLSEEQKITLCGFASEVKILSQERHRYVHGLWGLDAAGNLTSVFPTHKVGEAAEPVTPEKVRQTKLKTWGLYRKLLTFADANVVVRLPSKHKLRPKAPRDHQE